MPILHCNHRDMKKIPAFCGLVWLCLVLIPAHAQTIDSLSTRALDLPSRLLSRIQAKTDALNQRLTRQTERYLRKMAAQEARMRQKLYAVDSNAAKSLFDNAATKYSALGQQMQADTLGKGPAFSGTYLPYFDSLKGSVSFLQQNPQLLSSLKSGASPQVPAQLQSANADIQTLQNKLQDADAIKAYVQQRQQLIGNYIRQHADLQALLGDPYSQLKKQAYYYSQQVREYKEMWRDPDKLEKKTLTLLDRLPAFQDFMKNHSQLAGLFHLPGNYGSAQSLSGLQTNDQVSQIVQNQVAAGGASGAAAFQANLQSAQSELDSYKSKLGALGTGNGNAEMPDFRPNDQKTKTFWKRLEYGANWQTTRNNYMFPTVTDFGASLGYRLGHGNVAGIGASYKLGWGNGIRHIAFSSQGLGLRSYLMVKVKGSFSASGGFEYNYTTPFTSYQQLRQLEYWTKSGLIGLTRIISTKSKTFKKTTLSLLWDFLSYQQVPKTQPILFRVGYAFN